MVTAARLATYDVRDLITLSEAAALGGVTRSGINNWVIRGWLHCEMFGGIWWTTKSEVARALAYQRPVGGAKPKGQIAPEIQVLVAEMQEHRSVG